jgi:two-component system chemotaxis response regulator CheB
LTEGDLVRFRCRVGHAWSANGLVAEQSESIETALWTALRALEERAALCTRVAERMSAKGLDASAARFREQSAESRNRAAVLRQVLVSEPATNDEPGNDLDEAVGGPGDNGPEEDDPEA